MKTWNYYKNIRINYGFIALKNLNVTQGIWMIYLVSRGFSLFEVGLLEGIFHVTSFLMETPTGVVADLYGRKTSRTIGILFSILSAILIISSGGFLGIALGFMASALSYNFESGAGDALVYDSLLLEKREDEYMKVAGKLEVIMQLAMVVSLLVGGAIGNFSYVNTYFLSIALSAGALILVMFFKEPKVASLEQEKKQVKVIEAMMTQYKDCYAIVKGNNKLVYLIAFFSTIGTFVTLSFYYLQIKWQIQGFTTGQIGMFLALSCICGAVGGLVATKIDKKFGEKAVLLYMPLLVMAAIPLFYFVKVSIIAFAVVSFVESILYVTTRDYINKLIPSEKRATILSFESTIFSLFMITLFPAFGLVSDHIGISNAFLLLGGILVVLNIRNIFYWKGNQKEQLV
ncbi:MAG: MFS transporter [Vallitaleaceae bacterium]|nr:MFS transporter [Vallitaleaceae bacterium]